MGNSLWRLQTSLNYVAQMVYELSREEDVEVLVADWGSEIPLRDVLELSPSAARIVSFILIPPEIACDLQKDSPFAEVLALNAAARRAGGDYIGRIDQDILVDKHFIEYFFELYEGRQQLEVPLNSALLFANQRMVPYRFVVRCPSIWAVHKYIGWFGRFLKIDLSPKTIFWHHGVGIWLIHRNLWNECGGYDEQMIYMNDMEKNMIRRLMMKYQLVNLGQLLNYVFYHIEHYHPRMPRRSRIYRKVNPDALFVNPDILNPNGSDWGLVKYSFEKLPYSPDRKKVETTTFRQSPFEWWFFMLLIVSAGVQMAWDKIVKVKSFRPVVYIVWRRRAYIAWETVHGQPLFSWPRLLVGLWVQKKREKKTGRQEYL